MGMASALVFALDGLLPGLTGQVAVVTDGQLSGLVNKGIVVVTDPAGGGGGRAARSCSPKVNSGTSIDVPARTADLEVPPAELARSGGPGRRTPAPAPRAPSRPAALVYQRLVRPLPGGRCSMPGRRERRDR